MSLIILFYSKADNLKILCSYLYQKWLKNGGSCMGVLGGNWRFLTADLEDRVIQYDIDDNISPHPRQYPESFVIISLLYVCQDWEVLYGGTSRTLRVPDWRLGWQGHLWCNWWPCLTPRTLSWKFQAVISMFCEVINDFGVNGQPPW